jgi:pyruvate dehydrogenase E1 component beta subunit
VPGLIVIAPSNPYDAKGLLKSAIRSDDPVIFLEAEKMLNDRGEVPEGDYTVPIGVADIKRPGTHVTIVTYSQTVKLCMKAAEQLEAEDGISVEVIDLRTLRPLDEKTILQSVAKTHRLLVVDEDWAFCGFGAGIMAQLYDKCFDDLDCPIGRVCAEDVPVPFNHYLEQDQRPDVAKVVAKVRQMCY